MFIPHAKVFTLFDALFLRKMRITTDEVCPVCNGARKESHWQVIACSSCHGTGQRPVRLHRPECEGHDRCDCKVTVLRREEDDGA